MHPYSGTDTYPSFIVIPDDGDPDNAATFNVGYQGLGDRTKYLKALNDSAIAFITEQETDIVALEAGVAALEAYHPIGVVLVNKDSGASLGISLNNGGPTIGNSGALFSSALHAGDNVAFTVTSSFNFHTGALSAFNVLIEVQYQENGGGYVTLVNCKSSFQTPADAGLIGDYKFPFSMVGQHTIAGSAPDPVTLDWRVQMTLVTSGVGDTLTATLPFHATLVAYRTAVYP